MAELPFEIEYFQSSRILSHVTTTEREIGDLFRCLDISKACGPDGISNKTIKICADGLSGAFAKLVNLSFSVGFFRRIGKLQMWYQFLRKMTASLN